MSMSRAQFLKAARELRSTGDKNRFECIEFLLQNESDDLWRGVDSSYDQYLEHNSLVDSAEDFRAYRKLRQTRELAEIQQMGLSAAIVAVIFKTRSDQDRFIAKMELYHRTNKVPASRKIAKNTAKLLKNSTGSPRTKINLKERFAQLQIKYDQLLEEKERLEARVEQLQTELDTAKRFGPRRAPLKQHAA